MVERSITKTIFFQQCSAGLWRLTSSVWNYCIYLSVFYHAQCIDCCVGNINVWEGCAQCFQLLCPLPLGSVLMSTWKNYIFFFWTSVRFVRGGWGALLGLTENSAPIAKSTSDRIWRAFYTVNHFRWQWWVKWPWCESNVSIKCVPFFVLSLLTSLWRVRTARGCAFSKVHSVDSYFFFRNIFICEKLEKSVI